MFEISPETREEIVKDFFKNDCPVVGLAVTQVGLCINMLVDFLKENPGMANESVISSLDEIQSVLLPVIQDFTTAYHNTSTILGYTDVDSLEDFIQTQIPQDEQETFRKFLSDIERPQED